MTRPPHRAALTDASRHPGAVGALLVAGYSVFCLAAGGRSLVQLANEPTRAPLPYALSAVAAVAYLCGTIAVTRVHQGKDGGRGAALLCALEVAGVVIVGSAGRAFPGLFPEASVWSGFGADYGYVPAVLPVVTLAWLGLLGSTTSQASPSAAR